MTRFLNLLTLLLLLAGPVEAATLTGTVREAGGQPLGGMIVAAYTAEGILQATATTDFAGRYTVELPAGNYRPLAFDQNGVFATAFASNAEAFEVTPVLTLSANQTAQVDFGLVRAGRIAGTVATTGGVPLGNAVVAAYNLSGTRRGFTTTDGSGKYSLALPPGQYKLVAFDNTATYAAQFFAGRFSFESADRVTVTAGVTFSANFSLEVAIFLSGSVTDTSGRPLAGVSVFAYTVDGVQTGNAVTDVNGRFSMNIPAGTYRLVAADLSGTFANAFLQNASSFETSPNVTLSGGGRRTNLDFVMTRGGRVTGRVVDRATGTPLAGIVVAAYNLDGTQRASEVTSANGTYAITLPPGSFKLVAFDPTGTYALQFHQRQITFTGSTILAFAESVGMTADFDIERASHISGRVLEGALPATDVTVAAYTLDGVLVLGVPTDANGRYDLALPPGTYKVLTFDRRLRYATSYAGGAKNFEATPVRVLGANQRDTLDLTVVRGIRVTGIVRDERGNALGGIDVMALDGDGKRIATAQSASDGTFTLVLEPGRYFFAASDPLQRYAGEYFRDAMSLRTAAPFDVSTGAQGTLLFTMRPLSRHRSARG